MKHLMLVLLAAVLLFTNCASTGGSGGTELSLLEAIEQSAEKIAKELPRGSRVAIVAFESENDNLSDFIMEEITGALVDRGIEVADRQNLEYVYKELNFQMSADVSDETAQSIGKFLGAQLVITGQLTHLGTSYRYRTSTIHVEKATRDSITRLTVQDDEKMRSMIAAFANQTTVVKAAKYGVSEQTTPKTAGTFLDRGILFASRGDYVTAIEDFTEAIKLDMNLSTAYLLRGRALYASVSKVTSVGANFSSVDTLSTRGQATAEQVRVFEQAIADFTQALRLDPSNSTIYIQRGIAYTDKGDQDRAIADFDQALKLSPHYTTVYSNRALAYFDKGDHDRAIADFDQAIKLSPNNAAVYYNRGFVYFDKGDLDRAIADYNQAIKLNPNNAMMYNNRGVAYFNKGDQNRAIADYDQAIKLSPHYAEAYNNRGIVYYNKKDYNRAIADFDQVIRLDPNDAMAYNGRGSVYKAKGDHDRAIANYTQAIRLNPNFAATYYDRGIAYGLKGDYDRALADFDQAIRLNPNDTDAYVTRGAVYYHVKKDYDRTIADCNQALRLDPNNAEAKTLLEHARQARGR